MAIVNPVRDDHRTMLTTDVPARDGFSATITADLDLDLERPATRSRSKRTTEPLGGSVVTLGEEVETFLTDLEEEDEEVEGLEEAVTHSRRTGVTTTKHASGSEDAFQSYLHDIRGLGLITH